VAIPVFLDGWLLDYSPGQTLRSDVSWHPYCISRRIAVWVWLLTYSRDQINGLSEQLTLRMLNSLIHQAFYLSKNLERELGGNHLLENATALAIVSGVVETEVMSRLHRIALGVFAKELPLQVLEHGEYFERSPMYHCQVLSNLLRIETCCLGSELEKKLHTVARSMLQFVQEIVHPDGEIPLLSDSVFHEAASVKQIRDLAMIVGHSVNLEKRTGVLKKADNYYIFNSGETFVLCDFGAIAAPNLPSHAHCDALNIEVSIDNKRWIVDSGNYNYGNDSMRHYCRSSMAHNVVTVDDNNQANVWSIFRMGDRPNIFDHHAGSESGWSWASAAHDGYTDVGVGKVTRLVAMIDESVVCSDFQTLSGNLTAKSSIGYIHYHPEVVIGKILKVADMCFKFEVRQGGKIRSCTVHAESLSMEQYWFCEEFGRRRRATVVRYISNIKCRFSYWVLHLESTNIEIDNSGETVGIVVNNSERLSWSLV